MTRSCSLCHSLGWVNCTDEIPKLCPWCKGASLNTYARFGRECVTVGEILDEVAKFKRAIEPHQRNKP